MAVTANQVKWQARPRLAETVTVRELKKKVLQKRLNVHQTKEAATGV